MIAFETCSMQKPHCIALYIRHHQIIFKLRCIMICDVCCVNLYLVVLYNESDETTLGRMVTGRASSHANPQQ